MGLLKSSDTVLGESDIATPQEAAALIAPATVSDQGAMSAADKVKLNGLSSASPDGVTIDTGGSGGTLRVIASYINGLIAVAITALGLGNAATKNVGTSNGTVAAGDDSRMTNSRTPTAHATAHQPGGSDAMAVDALAATGSLRTLGTGAQQAAAGNHTHAYSALTGLPTLGTAAAQATGAFDAAGAAAAAQAASLQKSSNLSDLADAAVALENLKVVFGTLTLDSNGFADVSGLGIILVIIPSLILTSGIPAGYAIFNNGFSRVESTAGSADVGQAVKYIAILQ